MLCSGACAACGRAGTTRIFVGAPSLPNARTACWKTFASTKRKISGACVSTAELNVSVCQPFTTTMARSTNGRLGDASTKGSSDPRGCACGLSTKKSMSSSSRLVCTIYLRCCRTRNSCSSKYSRTMVSLTLDKLVEGWELRVERRRNEGIRHFLAPNHASDFLCQDEIGFPAADLFVEPH